MVMARARAIAIAVAVAFAIFQQFHFHISFLIPFAHFFRCPKFMRALLDFSWILINWPRLDGEGGLTLQRRVCTGMRHGRWPCGRRGLPSPWNAFNICMCINFTRGTTRLPPHAFNMHRRIFQQPSLLPPRHATILWPKMQLPTHNWQLATGNLQLAMVRVMQLVW